MARIRSFKPETYTSEQVAECSVNARYLWMGMWPFCDDAGVHPDSPKRLKMEIFPADDFSASDVEAMVDQLVKVGLVRRYEAEGKSYLWVTGWHHQKIDKPTYRYPPPPRAETTANNPGPLAEESAIAHPRSRVDRNGVDQTSIDRKADRPMDENDQSEKARRQLAEGSRSFPLVNVDDSMWSANAKAFVDTATIIGRRLPGRGMAPALRPEPLRRPAVPV